MNDDVRGGPPSWVVLLTLMVHGPDVPVRGAIHSRPGTDESFGWFAYGGDQLPVVAGLRASTDEEQAIRVWRDGECVRIEESDGVVDLIVGETTCWQFDRDHDAPIAAPRTAVHYAVGGTQLLTRREANEFLGDDFTRPTGPIGGTTFLGRPAWMVELAPPPHKPYPIQLVVDAETGLVLQQRNDGFGSVDEWVEFVMGERFEPELFTWTGPTRSADDQRAEWDAQHEADLAERRRWFAANVTDSALRVEVELTPLVHEYDEEAGSFQASLGENHGGMLARRPRSDTPWDLGWSEAHHRWSTTRWDWALTFHHDQLTPASIESLKQHLADKDQP